MQRLHSLWFSVNLRVHTEASSILVIVVLAAVVAAAGGVVVAAVAVAVVVVVVATNILVPNIDSYLNIRQSTINLRSAEDATNIIEPTLASAPANTQLFRDLAVISRHPKVEA